MSTRIARERGCARLQGAALLSLLVAVTPAIGQTPTSLHPDSGGLVQSMGQPPIWKPYLSVVAGSDGATPDRQFMSNFELGVFKDLLNPAHSTLGFALEAYGGIRTGYGTTFDVGARGLIESPTLRIGIGFDFNVPDPRVDPIFRLTLPLRRGGVLLPGMLLQANYLPTRSHSWHVGLTLPIGQHWRGRTRSRETHASFEPKRPPERDANSVAEYARGSPPPRALEALANADTAAHWIFRYTVPFIDQGGLERAEAYRDFMGAVEELADHAGLIGPDFPDGHTVEAEVRMFHAEIERAFSITISDQDLPLGGSTPLGRSIAQRARDLLLDEVILPYNRLLGQLRTPDSCKDVGRVAERTFAAELTDSGVLSPSQITAARYVFRRVLEIVEKERRLSSTAWNDPRLGWIPLQLAMLPEDHDTQEELDAIVARAVGTPWTGGNRVWYVRNAQFLWEIAMSVHRAEEYHVTWIHDIAFLDDGGQPDTITYMGMVDSYFGALIRAVREYDVRGTMPVFMIFFDQIYYEKKQSRAWMNVLEDPLEAFLAFPPGHEHKAIGLARAQMALRQAVEESRLLQERRARYGEDWLRNRIKVHVSITNPADPSFELNSLFPWVEWPDNIVRDHRKIVFYDISEDDPYRGMAIYSGMGVGEHYAGPTWEDRAVMAQGPALLPLKRQAYKLLLEQGFSRDEIPLALRPRPLAPDYDARVLAAAQDATSQATVMEIHNATGYGDKLINVAKAVLYTLMPPRSIIIIPDSLWNSAFFSALLFGSCLRGARVFIIAPSLDNAPGGNSFPEMSRAQELFARLIVLKQWLAEPIEKAGGMLKTGIYDIDIAVSDMPASVRVVVEHLQKYPWLLEVMPFSPELSELLLNADEEFGRYVVGYLFNDAVDRKPQLHLKTNFFATWEAWGRLLSQPGFRDVVYTYGVQQAILEEHRKEYTDIRPTYQPVKESILAVMEPWRDGLNPEVSARVAAYFMVGSYNQDYRSMFMDGEAVLLMSGTDALFGIFDSIYLLGTATWVETLAELEELLPEQSEFKWTLGRVIGDAL